MKFNPLCLIPIACLMAGCGELDKEFDSDMPSHYEPADLMPPDYGLGEGRLVQQERSETRFARGAPMRPRDSDFNWVNEQPSEHYTIQLERNEKATEVAKRLNQAPKTEHRAEIATRSGYVGVLGSFDSANSAAQALAELPENLRKDARVVQWREIQQN